MAHARADAGLGGERRWLTLVPRGPPAAPERRGPTMVHRQQHSSDMDQSWSIVSCTRATWTNHGPSSAARERHGPTMVHRQQHSSDTDQPWSIVSSTRATRTTVDGANLPPWSVRSNDVDSGAMAHAAHRSPSRGSAAHAWHRHCTRRWHRHRHRQMHQHRQGRRHRRTCTRSALAGGWLTPAPALAPWASPCQAGGRGARLTPAPALVPSCS